MWSPIDLLYPEQGYPDRPGSAKKIRDKKTSTPQHASISHHIQPGFIDFGFLCGPMTSTVSAGMRDEESQDNIDLSRHIHISSKRIIDVEKRIAIHENFIVLPCRSNRYTAPVSPVSSVVFPLTRFVYCCQHGWDWMTLVAGSSDSTVSHLIPASRMLHVPLPLRA